MSFTVRAVQSSGTLYCYGFWIGLRCCRFSPFQIMPSRPSQERSTTSSLLFFNGPTIITTIPSIILFITSPNVVDNKGSQSFRQECGGSCDGNPCRWTKRSRPHKDNII